jgi:hypothetical protein
LTRIKQHLSNLKKYTYGKHIVSRVEKLVTNTQRLIRNSSHAAPVADFSSEHCPPALPDSPADETILTSAQEASRPSA